jgi:hypothetical protein
MALLLALPPAARAEGPVNTHVGVAIMGYDTVAYFREATARRGSVRYRWHWNGAVWLFSAAANRDAFAAEPERFAPQYGGFSAYGMSDGKFYPVDPGAFLIVDGKLYLHANHYVRRRWSEDLPANIARADGHWRRLLREWSDRNADPRSEPAPSYSP